MPHSTVEHLTNMGTAAFASYRTLVGINERAIQRFTKAQEALLSHSLESGMEQWAAAGEAKSMEDIMSTQEKLLEAQSKLLVDYAQATAQTLKDIQDELKQWVTRATP